MRIHKFAAAALLGVAALGLSACAESLNTTVSRYQAMPAPQGQTFFVVPGGGMATNGGLEFQRYAGHRRPAAPGARLSAGDRRPQSANMVVQLGYGVDHGQVRYRRGPVLPQPLRLRRLWLQPVLLPALRLTGRRFYYGWDDPFWYGGYGGGIDSYVEYHSQIDLHIRAGGTNAPLFDGRAQARSQTDRLDVVVPSLVEAMFTGFPGRAAKR